MASEKPILFNGEMVRAILDGRKTQTRRVCTTRHMPGVPKIIRPYWYENSKEKNVFGFNGGDEDEYLEFVCKFGRVGDELWVRETMYSDGDGWWFPACGSGEFDFPYEEFCGEISLWCEHQISLQRLVVPSIHMPRWASRIQLKITDIRVERVKNITEEDAKDEGISQYNDGLYKIYTPTRSIGTIFPVRAFGTLWDSINANRTDKSGKPLNCSWDDNPWVWVVEFEVMK